jgi:hypothetical protein
MADKLNQLRASLSEDQQAVIDTIWRRYSATGEWPPVLLIHHALKESRVQDALASLPAGIVSGNSFGFDGTYGLSLAGVLLTSSGSFLEDLAVSYLDFIRNRWNDNPTNVQVKDGELGTALGISGEPLQTLFLLIRAALGVLSSGLSGTTSDWTATYPYNIAALRDLDDLRGFVRERATAHVVLPLDKKESETPREGSAPAQTAGDQQALPRPRCFVLMPFGGRFDEYHHEIIKPAIEDVGLEAARADDINHAGAIMVQVWTEIRESCICVADLSGRNPNVMYELGIAHALRKPVVQIVQNIEDVPFDLRHLRNITYDVTSARWGDDLCARLVEALRATLQNPVSALAFQDSPAAMPAP